MVRLLRRLMVLGLLGGGAGWALARRRRPMPVAPTASARPTTARPSPSSNPAPPSTGTSTAPNPRSSDDTVTTVSMATVADESENADVGSTDATAGLVPAATFLDHAKTVSTPWVAPIAGQCPDGYPIKGNDSSKIFHVPGGRSYARTIPERCYASEADAEADGYRRAKI